MFHSHFSVIAGNTPEGEIDVLRRYFDHVILLPPDESIAAPVACHPDMNFTVIGDALVTHVSYYRTAKEEMDRICALGGFRLILSSMERGADYPRDIGFNALIFNGTIAGNIKYLSPELVTLAESMGMEAVSVKQGYTACSSAYFGDLLCTADRGIARACEWLGAEVLLIPQNSGIALPGYEYGFIGGACGFCENTAFFYGNPGLHPVLAPLCDALERRGIEVVPLSEEKLTDRGGIRVFEVKYAEYYKSLYCVL